MAPGTGSYPQFCPVFVTWHVANGGRAGQSPFGSYIHQGGAKRVFPRFTTLATPGLSMHPAGEHPFGLLRLERVSASADLSQVDISSGSAKIRLWFLTRHYHPFQEPTGARPAQQRKDYLAAHSMVEAPCDTAGRGCDDPAMCRTTVDQPRAVHWLVDWGLRFRMVSFERLPRAPAG